MEQPVQDDALGNALYLEQRFEPRRGEQLYLHLSDLALYVHGVEVPDGAKILDFGAGGSPYREYFSGCTYMRADIGTANNPDYLISEKGIVDAQSDSFDVILSTQVAEHVENYRDYLGECSRLLKPDGKLILTVPGMYEEHECPGDFQRWMVQGLMRDVEAAGFKVEKMLKLTTGPRAIVFFFDRFLDTMQSSRKSVAGLSLFAMRLLFRPFRSLIHRFADVAYAEYRVVEAEVRADAFYLGLAVEARKL
jgi:SAM-dependent methyltransferase